MIDADGQTRPGSLRGFQGAIFDLDGTLLDTLRDIGNAANSVLLQHGFPTHPIEAYREFVGEGVQVLLKRALPRDQHDENTLQRCLQTMQVEYPRHLNRTARPFPGIIDLLSALRRWEFKLAVLSNKPDEYTARCVEDFFPNTFDPILGLRTDRPRKPDPAGAIEVAGRWGLPPQKICYFGDSGTDMQTATAAQMFPIGVLWGYRGEGELVNSGARTLIRHPADLLQRAESTAES